MKKMIFLLIGVLMLTLSFNNNVCYASGGDYLSYSELIFEDTSNKLLYEYSSEELSQYDDMIDSKKFSGWNTYYFKQRQKVNYTVGIIYMYKNEGKTASTYKFEYKEEKINKRSLNVTGSLEISVKAEIKKFKG